MTPNEILKLSEPLEAAYQRATDKLLINIAKHLSSPYTISTADWQVQKLSEMGQLNKENAAIIKKILKDMPEGIKAAMTDASKAALKNTESLVDKAIADGRLQAPIIDHVQNVIESQSKQATDQLNQVNTVMLMSCQQAFLKTINNTVLWAKAGMSEEQASTALNVLNEATTSVATGAEARIEALKRAITQMADAGLTGFVDRGGHTWTPEAYVNMDIRTTVHNTAIESVKVRQQDLGSNVFQCDSHPSCRPSHYPYQGHYYSWDNTSGSIKLGNGQTVSYEPVRVTGYPDDPGGLFGVNCRHDAIPVYEGISIPHGKDDIQAKSENDTDYSESQKQRLLERKIREAKRKATMLKSSGVEDTHEADAAIRTAQAKMRAFIDETGRDRRYDREQI